MKRILASIYNFLEGVGRARAAAILVHQHKYKEAQSLMLGEKK